MKSNRFAARDAQRVDHYRATLIGPYRDAKGSMFLAACPWALAFLAGRECASDEGCSSGSQCACGYDDEERPLTAPFVLASKTEADRYWDAIASCVEDPRW